MKSENRRYIKSSSFVMALLFTILCGLAALSLGYFINFFTKGHFVHSTEAVLDSEIRYIDAVGTDNLNNTNQLYLYLKPDGSLPDGIPSDLSRLSEGILVFDYALNQRRYAAKIYTLKDNRRLLIGTDITNISQDFQRMQWMGIISICFVMMVVFVSYLISIFVVSGTNNIADTAREIIDTGDLSRRVSVGSRWDDLSNTAAVLNMLLERVEELMRGVRQVSDNIAHDLRTPLTRLRSQLETLSDNKDKAVLLAEADQLLNTFNALLRISRIEAGQQRSQFTSVNLQQLLADVIAFYEPLAEDKSITMTSDLSEASIQGDRDLLFQVYANLLDNALKFTPAGGHVEVSLFYRDDNCWVVVSDSGCGVNEQEKYKIFDRFYRGELSRNKAGSGLGLSLVSAVIKLHNGKLQVENTQPGLKIITIL